MNRSPSPEARLDGLEDCPEIDALAQYAEGTLGARRRAELDAHVGACDPCRSLVASLARAGLTAPGAVDPGPASRLRWVPSWVSLAAAAAVVAVGLTFALRPRAPAAPDTDARLVALAARLAADRPDLFSGFRSLDASERRADPTDVQRGGIEWMWPAGLTVATRPTFEWTAIDGASEYLVSVIDAEGTRILSTKTADTRLEGSALAAPLVRGGAYAWKVIALGAATPAAGSSELHVASEADARVYEEVVSGIARATNDSLRDLATAHALVRRGWIADALPFARRYVEALPTDPVGRETLDFVRRRSAPAAKPG